jgi:hypothetical protein
MAQQERAENERKSHNSGCGGAFLNGRRLFAQVKKRASGEARRNLF